MLQRLLYPKLYVSSVRQIDLDALWERGIRCVLFDLDNTVVPRDVSQFSPEITRWFEDLRKRGFKTCIVSNNGPGRVHSLAGPMNLPFVCRAVKPRKRPFIRAMELLGVSPGETAVIGDQIFTDILGGNRLGLYTILVVPMPGKEYWATELINRRLERLVLSRLNKNASSGCGGVKK